MKLFKKTFIILLTLSFVVSLVACSKNIEKPQKSVSDFFDAVKRTDINTASKYLQGGYNNDNFKFQNAEEEKITKLLFSNFSYEVLSASTVNDSAKVKVKVTSPDIKDAYNKVTEDVIQSTLANSTSGAAPKEADMQKIILDKLTAIINDPKVKKYTKEYELNLVKNSEKTTWIIKADNELKNALTGNSLELENLK